MRPSVDAHEEEGGVDLGRLQHVEHGGRVEGIGAVIEGERHYGFVGVGAEQGVGLDGCSGGIGASGVATVGTHPCGMGLYRTTWCC